MSGGFYTGKPVSTTEYIYINQYPCCTGTDHVHFRLVCVWNMIKFELKEVKPFYKPVSNADLPIIASLVSYLSRALILYVLNYR